MSRYSNSIMLQLPDGTRIEVTMDNCTLSMEQFELHVIELLNKYTYEDSHLRYIKTHHKG
jgi:hypothetical protein